jgi:hypothetical protein
MLLPALTKAKLKAQGIQCMSNHRQLCLAWRLYAEDNREILPYASHNGNRNDVNSKMAWTLTEMSFGPDPYNWDPEVDIKVRCLWPYSKSVGIYKCPADTSNVTDAKGISRSRCRTMSMNLYVGGFAPRSGSAPGTPGDTGGVSFGNGFVVYSKMTDISGAQPSPSPSKLFVFMDQREDRINWGNYMTDMNGYYPNNEGLYEFDQDMPGMYHHRAAGFSFADGHSEIHRWKDGRTCPPLKYGQQDTSKVSSPRNQDIRWLQDISTRLKSGRTP